MQRIGILATFLVAAFTAMGAQNPPAPRTPPGKAAAAQPVPANRGAGLQFLGAYSAPQAIRETETGHTSARPPAPSTAARLRALTGTSGGDAATRLRRAMRDPQTPAQWFQVGIWCLAVARQASRALARQTPNSTWNRQLDAAALRWARSGEGEPAPAPAQTEWQQLRQTWRGAETPARLYQRARSAEALGAAAFQRAAQDPGLEARIDGLRALAASQADEFALAARAYRAGLALAPHDAALHAGLGELERSQRRYPAAARELAVAWRLNPRDPVTAFAYGDVLFRLNHPRRALRVLDRAVASAPRMLVARWTRAEVETSLGRDPAALRDYLAAQDADRSGKLQYQLARLYTRMGRPRAAAAAFGRSAAQRAARRR
ncbi:MAG: hypothetical protein ACRD2E_12335 [Terriglobales bacterium]